MICNPHENSVQPDKDENSKALAKIDAIPHNAMTIVSQRAQL